MSTDRIPGPPPGWDYRKMSEIVSVETGVAFCFNPSHVECIYMLPGSNEMNLIIRGKSNRIHVNDKDKAAFMARHFSY